ncbi:NAD(P)/FAD-dependent oxidoreductase [Alphaproteobacteria bacterium]|jgi:cation diffusion facilitator CzcD-associated flavoprotein CzcO|nr:NAD(P)/FAD-dependent oxidoreductase [Alphaproteobacteria bacterium]
MGNDAWAIEGRQPRIAIIGAGMSGIAAVVKLRKAGFEDITVFEKTDRVGGTWRENRYPGLSCDVPSYWYSFSFARNPDWSHRYAYGPEIQAYMERVANDFDVISIVKFNTAVTDITYDDPIWHVTTSQGDEEVFDIVISATGVLHHTTIPNFKDREKFAGESFHTAKWQDDVDLSGKRVGIIGTGSTSAQIIGAMTEHVEKMVVFQRTPQWIAPRPQKKYSPLRRFFMRYVPGMTILAYWIEYLKFKYTFGPATTGNKYWEGKISELCQQHLDDNVQDPVLKAKLTPNYQAACKRLIFASEFYPAISRPNCDLVTDEIDRMSPVGIITKDGEEHALDVLIYATGFDAAAFILPTKVTGENGRDLKDFWEGSPRAHRAVSVPGFPNFWMIEGPTGPVGNLSLIMVSEHQIDYIISMLKMMKQKGIASLAPKQDAFASYNAELGERVKQTVWYTGGCDSWYFDKTGKPNLYSFPPQKYLQDMHAPNLDEYETRPALNHVAAE